MTAARASETAKFQATFRALESVRWPARRRLFTDEYAVRFLDPAFRGWLRWARLPLLGEVVRALAVWRSSGAITSDIARTRLLDELLLRALSEGARQVAILGAGFDYRALRIPQLRTMRVVEIDQPATQALKRQTVGELANVTWVASDLTQEPLEAAWSRAGLDPQVPTFVLWEGVAHYLGEAAVDATVRALGRLLPTGSWLAFTYLHRGLLDGSVHFRWGERVKRRVAAADEPWLWGQDPGELPSWLAARGFERLVDEGADEYRARYWGNSWLSQGFGFYRVALARVSERAGSRAAPSRAS